MKNFILEKIWLMSSKEKKAISIKFHPETTIILGKNDTGKSSLLKSIYWTFGTEPFLHPTWKQAGISSLVSFKLNGTSYYILRHNGRFGLFDGEGFLIESFKSVTKELAPYLAKMFNFDFPMQDRSGNDSIPLPAYYFLPFYIDQDKSWSENWSSFENLHQFSYWRDSVVNYHVGIKTKEYYELKSAKEKLKKEKKEAEDDKTSLEEAYSKFSERLPVAQFDIDSEFFKVELDELIQQANNLNKSEQELKNKLRDYNEKKLILKHQLKILESTIKETDESYKLLMEEGGEIECPTCAAPYKNSFAERFYIAKDQQRCADLIEEIQVELSKLDKKTERANSKYQESHSLSKKIKHTLNIKKETVKLQDLIKNEGKKEVKKMVTDQVGFLQQKMANTDTEIDRIEKEIKKIQDQKHKKQIMDGYHLYMEKYLNELDVDNLPLDYYKRITTKIGESGSDLPRALLAYYFSILRLIKEFSSEVFAPIIIDSPNQQAQDDLRLPKILKFISKEKIENSQLILGLEDLHGVEFEGDVVKLKKRNSLLSEDKYKSIQDKMNPFIDQVLLDILKE